MAFIPNYKYDIFVSYAHVDDQPLPGAEEGWVTTLIKGLKTGLNQKLGRSDIYRLWIDHELSRHVLFPCSIERGADLDRSRFCWDFRYDTDQRH